MMFFVRVALLLLASGNAFEQQQLMPPDVPNVNLESKASKLMNENLKTMNNEFEDLKDKIDELGSVLDYTKEDYTLQQNNFLDVRGLEERIGLLEVLQKGDDPGFVVYDFSAERLILIKSDKTLGGEIQPPARIRGMYHNPFTRRVFTFVQPITSYDLYLQNKQIINSTTVYKRTMTGGMEGDPCRNELYFTFISRDEIWKVGMDGSGLTRLVTRADSNGPLGIRIARDKGILYWADYYGKALKSVDIDGNNITTIYKTAPWRPRSLDLDLKEGKIYWCGDKGYLFSFDTTTGINKLIDNNNPNQCDTLRLWNGHIYMSHGHDKGIRKLSLDGSLVKMIYDGGLRPRSNKYFNIL